MKRLFKHILFILCILLHTAATFANNFSYVYIQGDKKTPFYVKFEDEMLPRYGKNYSIISQLSPGPIHIQILFQQNQYPPQSFTILVPENGSRGFLLSKKGDAFSLYDIQQQFYLPAGNTQDQDKLPETNDIYNPPIAIAEPEVNADTNLLGQPLSGTGTKTATNTKAGNAPKFMDMELDHKQSSSAGTTATQPSDDAFKGKVAVINSDCPRALDNDLFDAIKKKANDKSDHARLKYLLEKLDNNCFTTNQIRSLTRLLDNDPERYTFLKKAYSRVTDQSVFPNLESLLSSREWKDYFKLILP